MKKIRKTVLLASLALGLLLSTQARAEDFKVVVNASNPVTTIAKGDLADMFLKKTANWKHGIPVAPVDQADDGSLHRSFAEGVIGKSQSALRSFWQQRIFSGKGVPPLVLDSDQALLDYVAKNRGAVGYVSAGTATGTGVKSVTLQ